MGILNYAYDFPTLFKEGVETRMETARQKLQELKDRAWEMPPAEYVEKKTNWEAMVIAGKGFRFARRYAELARNLAAEEVDGTRRRNWRKLRPPSTRCRLIRPGPSGRRSSSSGLSKLRPSSWRCTDTVPATGSTRFSGPITRRTCASGSLTRGQALEIVECLFLKIQELGIALEWPVTFTGKAGGDVFYTLNICGSNDDGSDASNDLSCLIMEAMSNLHINQPPVALRYHQNIAPEIVERAIELLHLGMGHPSWFNEDLLEKWALLRGYSPEDAKHTQVSGCVTNNIPNKYIVSTGTPGLGAILLPRLLEETLHEGGEGNADRPDKPRTKDPREMRSADEVLDAFCSEPCSTPSK